MQRGGGEETGGVLVMEPTLRTMENLPSVLGIVVFTLCFRKKSLAAGRHGSSLTEAVVGGRKRLDLGDAEETECLDLATGWCGG